jgi:hypothetical protein
VLSLSGQFKSLIRNSNLRAEKSQKRSENGLISLSKLTKYFIYTVPKMIAKYFIHKVPNRIAKYQVLAQLCLCQVRWDMDKSERVDDQEALHTADRLTD